MWPANMIPVKYRCCTLLIQPPAVRVRFVVELFSLRMLFTLPQAKRSLCSGTKPSLCHGSLPANHRWWIGPHYSFKAAIPSTLHFSFASNVCWLSLCIFQTSPVVGGWLWFPPGSLAADIFYPYRGSLSFRAHYLRNGRWHKTSESWVQESGNWRGKRYQERDVFSGWKVGGCCFKDLFLMSEDCLCCSQLLDWWSLSNCILFLGHGDQMACVPRCSPKPCPF